MKIEDKRFSEPLYFKDVYQGDVFIDADEEEVFIKVETVIANYTGLEYNAVKLTTGRIDHFELDEKVRTIKAKVVIG